MQPTQTSPIRLASLDVYRGFVMFLMVAEVLQLPKIAKLFPDSTFWQYVKFHTTHVEWAGCSLHDLIQPSFSFLVGVALPFSIANRLLKGDSFTKLTIHALWRSLILILLGVFLRSTHATQTNWTFEDTLTQIGLGYFFLFLLGWTRPAVAWIVFVLILVGYWTAWVMYPSAGPDFISHWAKNQNLGWAFDTWFLNLFPRKAPFTANGGGYLTLSFIPTLATMILGLIAGWWLQDYVTKTREGDALAEPQTTRKTNPLSPLLLKLIVAGFIGLASGYALNEFNICPNVKRIWTPTLVLFSGGWCFLLLAFFVAVVDGAKLRWPFFVFLVFGVNSIAIYCLAHLIDGFIVQSLQTHLGKPFFNLFGKDYEPLFMGVCVLLILWLILFWMYRRKLFLKI